MSHPTMRDYEAEYMENQNSPRDIIQPTKRRNNTFLYLIGIAFGVILIVAIIVGALVGSGTFSEESSKEQASGDVNENASTDAPTPADVAEPKPTVCSFDANDAFDLMGDGSLMMRNFINLAEKTVSVQLQYNDEAWLGFAFTEAAEMIPNIAVIGLPNDSLVQKYSLTLRDLDGVIPLEEARQSLLDSSIIQVDGQTTLDFTKLLSEGDEVIVKTDAPNRFNWAIGPGNDLAQHAERGSVLFAFNVCDGKDPLQDGPSVSPLAGAPAAPPVADDNYVPTYAPTYAPTVYNDKYTNAPVENGATESPSYTPSYSPSYKPSYTPSYEPSYNPTLAPIEYETKAPTYAPTYKQTYKPTNAPTYYEPKTGSWSKRGNRRSCAISVCPSAPWTGGEYTAKGAKCENGLDASYWNGTATYYEYYTDATFTPTEWDNVWKMEAMGKELPIGWGGDFASGNECYDDKLRGGFRVDLTGTDWWFAEQSYTVVEGYSPSMKMIADDKEVGEWNLYNADGEYSMKHPEGAKVIEVVCGGWPANCNSYLYVKKNTPPPVPAPVAPYNPGY